MGMKVRVVRDGMAFIVHPADCARTALYIPADYKERCPHIVFSQHIENLSGERLRRAVVERERDFA